MDASAQQGGIASPDLAPDVATTEGSIDHSDAVALAGYLGEGCTHQYRRLYENVALNRWIEMRVADIVDRVPAPPPPGHTVVWVQRDAVLALCESVRASEYEGPAGSCRGAMRSLWPRP
jgi:hypothetical protein